ncbi:MAG: DUF2304 domain-containing protein [Lachnospiraceae bacterium]|nr:DUF2304 domain-containing protein [Lachnospiraceae bacterium]
MSLPLRVMLIVASILTGFYIREKLKKSQMQIADVLFWLFFAVALIFMSIFPEAVEWFTDLLGVQSPVNFVFLVVIFLVIIRCFALSVKVSHLEAKLDGLVEDVAVDRAIEEANAESNE